MAGHPSRIDSEQGFRFARPLFLVAAIFNYGIADALLLLPDTLAAIGIPRPGHPLFLHLCALLIAGLGLAYHLVSRDPTRNHGIVVIGAIGKLAVFALLAGHVMAGSIPFPPLMLGAGDLVFAVLFIWFLLPRREA